MLQPAKVATLRIETPRAFLPLLSPARYKGAYGGRGSGKSHFFADMLIEECVADPTTRAVCIREIQKSLSQSVKQLLEDKIKARSAEGHFEVLDTEIFVLDPAGNRTGIISFQGMQNHTAESIKSLEGYRIAWVEEAQSLSQRSLDLLTPTLREAQILRTMTTSPSSRSISRTIRGSARLRFAAIWSGTGGAIRTSTPTSGVENTRARAKPAYSGIGV
jgi:phage terminase large subunit